MSREMKSCFTGSSSITALEMVGVGVVLLSDLEKLFLPWKIRAVFVLPR